jgi:hypothetical protein
MRDSAVARTLRILAALFVVATPPVAEFAHAEAHHHAAAAHAPDGTAGIDADHHHGAHSHVELCDAVSARTIGGPPAAPASPVALIAFDGAIVRKTPREGVSSPAFWCSDKPPPQPRGPPVI